MQRWDWLTLGFICKEVVDLGDCAVERNDIDSVVSSVENQILPHDSEADKAEISSGNIVSILSFAVCVRNPVCGPPMFTPARRTLQGEKKYGLEEFFCIWSWYDVYSCSNRSEVCSYRVVQLLAGFTNRQRGVMKTMVGLILEREQITYVGPLILMVFQLTRGFM